MIIFGPCSAPTVYVSGHAYTVNCDAELGEYITIDSVEKTVTKTAIDGTTTNVFNLRGRESYIFEKIGAGANTVVWDGGYGVDIILMEERSEPKWI
jgi:phage-related protein